MAQNDNQKAFDRTEPYAVLCFAPADRAFAEADAAALTERGYNVYLNAGDRAADTAAVEDKNCRLILFYLSAAGVTDLGCSVLMGARSSLKARQTHGGSPVPFAIVETVTVGDLLAFVQAEEDRLDSTVAATPEAQKQLDDASRALLRFEQILYNAGSGARRIPAEPAAARSGALCELLKRAGCAAAPGAPVQKTDEPARASGFADQTPLEAGLAALEEKRYEDALKALRRAAFKGDPLGMFHLGRCFENGWGAGRDEDLAAQYYQKAADAGLAEAQLRFGVCCETGKGVPRDLDMAERYYTLAGERDVDEALERLEGLMKKRKAAPASPVPAPAAPAAVPAAPAPPAASSPALDPQYEEARALYKKKQYAEAFRLFMSAAQEGHAGSQYDLGVCYEKGNGVARDRIEAVKWYRKAAEQGHVKAQCDLSRCYRNGIGVAKDDAEAVKWYRKAAEQGDMSAQYDLGLCYKDGTGVAKDDAERVKWYRKAAEQGHAKAQCDLGWCYETGTGVAKEDAEAVRLYRRSDERGYSEAYELLGLCYEKGRGIPADHAEAVKWYRKAAAKGSQYAKAALARLSVG